jgi:hypothetical protein
MFEIRVSDVSPDGVDHAFPMTSRRITPYVAFAAAVLGTACEARMPSQPTAQPRPMPVVAPGEASPATTAPAASAPESPAAQKPVRRPGAWANVDPDDDDILGPPDPIDDCEGVLKGAGVTFAKAKLPVHEEKLKKTKITCGASQVVTYLKGPAAIAYSSPPLLTCAMAAALASFERLLQEEASAILKSPIARIEHLGTYNCREMPAYPGWVSEHSYANAIDIARFALKDGRVIDVMRDFDVGEDEPKKANGRFLRVVSRRANDEDVFSHVLTPFFDAIHKNHFHLDLSRYRADGTRPRF